MTGGNEAMRTALYDAHLAAGARMVEFAGWQMPVQYTGVMEEHRAVRNAAGLFDVSHMGEFRVSGAGAEAFLQRMTPNNVARLRPGRAHYSGLLTERGTYVDDILVYRLAAESFMVVVNAANLEKDFDWLRDHTEGEVQLDDVSADTALIALQGPKAQGLLQQLTAAPLGELKYYRFFEGEVAGRPALVSRTGYTGEDGFELYLSPADAPEIWQRLVEIGGPEGLLPAGLGARDTLRLEAAMALYGHEIDDTVTPLEAGLSWVVKLDKGDFLGRQALVEQQQAGVPRRLVGFEIRGRGIARHGYQVEADGREIGLVTSGTWSPTLEKALGMALVPAELGEPGTMVNLTGKRTLEGEIVGMPFYRRPK